MHIYEINSFSATNLHQATTTETVTAPTPRDAFACAVNVPEDATCVIIRRIHKHQLRECAAYAVGHTDGYDAAQGEHHRARDAQGRSTAPTPGHPKAKPVPDLPTLQAEATKRGMEVEPDARAGCYNVYWGNGSHAFCVSLREVAEQVIGG